MGMLKNHHDKNTVHLKASIDVSESFMPQEIRNSNLQIGDFIDIKLILRSINAFNVIVYWTYHMKFIVVVVL